MASTPTPTRSPNLSPRSCRNTTNGTRPNICSAAALINLLETKRYIDFNGVVRLSQILNFDVSPDGPQFNPGVDLPYQLSLPTYAATAWYHHKLAPSLKDLPALLEEVEHFAMTDYAQALQAGAALDPARRDAVAAKLHDYTGLPVDYIKKADLGIKWRRIRKNQDDRDTTTGRLDTRFSGPTMDPLSKDGLRSATSRDRVGLCLGIQRLCPHDAEIWRRQSLQADASARPVMELSAPAAEFFRPLRQAANVMPDLAWAMKYNPNLKVQLNAGYFDLSTPFYESIYEMRHLPMPTKLQANIEYKFYQSGHMVYAHEAALKQLHDNVVAFIRTTDHLPADSTAPMLQGAGSSLRAGDPGAPRE